MNMLPAFPASLTIQTWMKPAGQVGGDFVVFAETATGWRVIMGDISGHGDEVATTAMLVRDYIKRDIARSFDPGRMRMWNRDLQGILDGRFVCLTCLESNTKQRTLTIANAGNPAVLIRRGSGRVDAFSVTGPVLGILDDFDWIPPTFVTTELAEVDNVVCFTDGLTERVSPQREQFGLERVVHVVSRACSSPVRMIRRCLRSFTRGSARQDDVTLLMLQPAYAM